jgi:PGAP1-like protein.
MACLRRSIDTSTTFRSVEENGKELAELIVNRVKANRLLIVAHSRGGLVARFSLNRLRKSYQGETYLYTFGTPHGGTPLVNIGGKALNLFFKLGEDITSSIPVMMPLTKAYSYLIDTPDLPPGIEVMRENSEVLSVLNEFGDPDKVSSWASNFDLRSGASGFGVEVEGALLGALSGVPHDLVVPTSSGLAFGTAQPVLAYSHLSTSLSP